MANKKKTTSNQASTSKLIIERGGEKFQIEEADGLFAVKRKTRSGSGALEAAHRHPETFASLSYRAGDSTADVEVYSIEAKTRDAAMKILREERADAQWCAHLYHMPNDPNGLMIPTDTIYVEIEEDADPEVVNRLLEEHGLELMPASDDDPGAFVLRLTGVSKKNPIKIANALSRSKAVKLAEPGFAMKMQFLEYRPTDPLFPDQWHLENQGGFGLTAGADVRAPGTWEITRGNRSVRVCVMDDGVQLDHPDFSSSGKIVAPYDFGQKDQDPNPVSTSDNHGTSCAGVAVADENGQGVVGIAPNCALMPYRTSGFISDESIRALFDRARIDGADVISCSWGVAAAFFSLTTPMKKAINRAATEGRGGLGCVIVFASGNENSPVDGINPETGNPVRSGFAIHPDVIAVNASNSRDVRSDYSNYGPETWVCAPSSGSGGRRIVTTDRTGSAGYQAGDYTTVNGFGGTSSSCPLVAGICGLILSANPYLTSSEVKEILQVTSDKIDQANGDYDPEGHSDKYGYGRVNALRAVERARDLAEPSTARMITFESTPDLAIPEYAPAGVTDSIEIVETATVQSVEVSVEIEHTYRGDLVVELVGPSGTSVPLHERSGGGANNLVATYSMAELPALGNLTGAPGHGSWTLRIFDHARMDAGRLVRWRLTLGLAGGSRTEWRVEPGLTIPDNNPDGIVSEIEVEEPGSLVAIELDLDISHTYRGDLRVSLESPTGLTALLHDRVGGSGDNINRTFTTADTAPLQALVDAGGSLQGTWKLRITDRAARDIGKLNAWTLRLLTGASGPNFLVPHRKNLRPARTLETVRD